MVRYHNITDNRKVAEILPDTCLISNPQEMLDVMAEEGYNGCIGIIMYDNNLHKDFFDLKTGLAGEILQKFSNYRMKLAIVGDFSHFKSKSLRDLIKECNTGGTICFVDTLDEALTKLSILL
jgi:hypothetical protein